MRFDTLFKTRKHAMALAILLVLLIHLKWHLPDGALKTAISFTYFSVDIFFFASGVGCCFSLLNDPDVLRFWKRRALRILPVYLPFILVWIAVKAFQGEMCLSSALANLLGLGGVVRTPYPFNWYVSGMWISYLLAPVLVPLAVRADTRAKAAAATAALLVLSAACWGDEKLIIIAARIPIFFVGMLFAAESRRRERLSRAETLLLTALVPAGFALCWEIQKYFPDLLWDYGLFWYPCLLLVPGIMIVLAQLREALERLKVGRALNRAAAFLGGLTFELYLTHWSVAEQSLPVFFAVTVFGTAAVCYVSRCIRRALNSAG